MADIETLRREFEAAYQTESLRKYRFCYNWHSDGGCYISDLTQTAFTAFCAGRKSSRADDAIERYRNNGEFANSSPEECIDDLLTIAADYERLKAEIDRLKQFEECYTRARQYIIDNGLQVTTPSDGDLAEPVYDVLHSQRVEIERLQSIVDRIPKFADGSPALPGDEAWHPDFEDGWVDVNMGKTPVVHRATFVSGDLYKVHKPLSECYPTREAMEKANEG